MQKAERKSGKADAGSQVPGDLDDLLNSPMSNLNAGWKRTTVFVDLVETMRYKMDGEYALLKHRKRLNYKYRRKGKVRRCWLGTYLNAALTI